MKMKLVIGLLANAAYISKLYNKQCTASDSVKKQQHEHRKNCLGFLAKIHINR